MPDILSFLQKILSFVALISIVVIVHEFGHFIVARLCGVGVEAFSLFFGKPIFKRKKGFTEWRIGCVPIGGYVKMVGQSDTASTADAADAVPEDLREISFAHKPLWARAAIVAAGPIMNLVLAFVIFSALFFYGYPTATTLIGEVDDNGAGYAGGLRPGDRVVAIDGKSVWRWDDMAEIIEKSPDMPLAFTVERAGQKETLTVTPTLGRQKNIFQFEVSAGLLGIGPDGLLPILGIKDPNSPAAAAGLKTGDLVKKINGKPVNYFADIDTLLGQEKGPLTVVIERGGLARDVEKRIPETVTAVLDGVGDSASGGAASLGLERGDLFVLETVPESPAAVAGFLPGDRILAVDAQPLETWSDFTKIVRANPEKELKISLIRDGKEMRIPVVPELASQKDITGSEIKIGRIGLYPWISYSGAEIKDERYWNPFKAVWRGVEMTVHWTYLTIQGFFFLLTGDVSVKTLGGPIMIADLAGKTASSGAFSFIMFIAIISLNLAVLNLMPVPVLDGGHLMLFGIEAVIRRPVPETGQRIATNIGLFLVGVLMLATLYNDLLRVFPRLANLFGFLQ